MFFRGTIVLFSATRCSLNYLKSSQDEAGTKLHALNTKDRNADARPVFSQGTDILVLLVRLCPEPQLCHHEARQYQYKTHFYHSEH